jgi:glucose-6-phosphate isomerase
LILIPSEYAPQLLAYRTALIAIGVNVSLVSTKSALPETHPGESTSAWRELQAHALQANAQLDLRELFAADAARFEKLSFEAPHVLCDLSKQRWNADVRASLLALAKQQGFEAWRSALFAGAAVNNTEGRAAMHFALRGGEDAGASSVQQAASSAAEVRAAFLRYAEAVREKGVIRDVVNIGIGGSDLGPRMACAALLPHTLPGLRMHFVANVDAHDLDASLAGLNPNTTLFIVCSKTFTTRETLLNAELAKAWFVQNGGTDIAQHFVGVTTNVAAAKAFGIDTTFPFWDWVGGRYSLWSAIGLSIAIAVGAAHFQALLQGAVDMDAHFAQAPPEANVPLQLALIELWNRNHLSYATRCVAPYHHGLRLLPAYLQQLEMESNGKSVSRNGERVAVETCGVVWGEAGTNAQHSFFQMLHQGTQVVPVEFILVKHADHAHANSQTIVLANALAQSQALMQGKSTEQAAAEKAPTSASNMSTQAMAKHRTFEGNRPSTTLVLDSLTPQALGALIALYEHKTFALGVLWGINSFDQWGVELGKSLALDLEQRFAGKRVEGLDSSAAGLMKMLLS